ncbi:MAG: phage integrase SAM-like domain-containing protein [Planctomycetaceae bacterium]|jgi:integrase|nr:phage integrase SAM-like domain-containing protein [Planctomycetaceae bacterium]
MRAYQTSQGNWQLNFSEQGKQKTLYLGKSFTASAADRVARIVTEIVACRDRGDSLPLDLQYRIRDLPSRVRSSLERFGIVSNRFGMTLKELFDCHVKTKERRKVKTIKHYQQWYKRLLGFFNDTIKVSSITKEKAEKFADFCEDALAPCTIYRGLGTCRAIFDYAVNEGIISVDPFSDIYRGQRTNEVRQYYVERETINKVLLACADDFERLVIVLARYGGLRIPSEIRKLRYGDFTETLIRIHKDTKTGARDVPLFREVKEIFCRLSGDLEDLIFSGYLSQDWGPWSMLAETIERIGLTRWPKLFVNLRSSCITDLADMGYSEKTLDAIFGNSMEVRKSHYIQLQKEKEYKKVLADNAAIVNLLCKNGGTFESEEKGIPLHEILALRDLLVSRFPIEKTKSL